MDSLYILKDMSTELDKMAKNLIREINDITDKDLKTFDCQLCSSKFVKNKHLQVHTKKEHENEKYFDCQLCVSKFGEIGTLKIHLKEVT